jgi:hypothetical protein
MNVDEQLKVILDDLNFATDKLSDQTRQVSFGVLAVVWALLVGDARNRAAVDQKALLVVTAIAIGALIADLLQYLAAFAASERAKKNLQPTSAHPYDDRWLSYRLRTWMFFTKIVLALAAAAVLIASLVRVLLT